MQAQKEILHRFQNFIEILGSTSEKGNVPCFVQSQLQSAACSQATLCSPPRPWLFLHTVAESAFGMQNVWITTHQNHSLEILHC